MGVSGQRHAPAALYPWGKDPRYPFDWRLGGPQSQSGQVQKLHGKKQIPLKSTGQAHAYLVFCMHVIEIRTVLAEPEASTPLISKLSTGIDPEPDSSASEPHNIPSCDQS
jgi:hypothetical protein